MLTQELTARGVGCINLDSCVTEPVDATESENLFTDAADWMYDGERDVTIFRGVSLGRKLLRQTLIFTAEFRRMSHCVKSLLRVYRPHRIIFRGCSFESQIIDCDAAAAIVAHLAGGTQFERRPAANKHGTETVRYSTAHTPAARSNMKNSARHVAAFILFALIMSASRIFALVTFRGRAKALMLTTQLALLPLLHQPGRFPIRPLVMYAWLPNKKRIFWVLNKLARGMLLVAQPKCAMSDADKNNVNEIELAAKAAGGGPAGTFGGELKKFVGSRLVDQGALGRVAGEVIEAEELLRRHRPNVVFTDSINNSRILSVLDVARQHGVPTAMTWHAHYLQDLKVPVFGADHRCEPVNSHVFSWGEINEQWLQKYDLRTSIVRTGNIISNQHRVTTRRDNDWRNVVVLQYAFPNIDISQQPSNEFEYLLAISKIMKEEGIRNFKLRLHPGTSAKLKYYQTIVDHYGIDCHIDASGHFKTCLEWADVVIGPVQSGAMLESLTFGHPYFPVLMRPSSVNMSYLAETEVFEDFESLHRRFRNRDAPDLSVLREKLTSRNEVPDTASMIWNELAEIAVQHRT